MYWYNLRSVPVRNIVRIRKCDPRVSTPRWWASETSERIPLFHLLLCVDNSYRVSLYPISRCKRVRSESPRGLSRDIGMIVARQTAEVMGSDTVMCQKVVGRVQRDLSVSLEKEDRLINKAGHQNEY
ncbi:hypothetical protein LguiA_018280 [Lonicera macranthoides]